MQRRPRAGSTVLGTGLRNQTIKIWHCSHLGPHFKAQEKDSSACCHLGLFPPCPQLPRLPLSGSKRMDGFPKPKRRDAVSS